jgi:aminopeptidase N
VLHMLRELIGDDAFFRGLRRFYQDNRFSKVGTENVRQAFEQEAGRPLERFFSQWIDTSALPHLTVNTRTEAGADGSALVITIEQGTGVFDVPVPFILTYEDGTSSDVMVRVTDRVAHLRVPLPRVLRRVAVNRAELAAAVVGG